MHALSLSKSLTQDVSLQVSHIGQLYNERCVSLLIGQLYYLCIEAVDMK